MEKVSFQDVKARYELTGWKGVRSLLKNSTGVSFSVVEFGLDKPSTRAEKHAFIDSINRLEHNKFAAHYYSKGVKAKSGYSYNVLRVQIVEF